jgi:hypothetical protein
VTARRRPHVLAAAGAGCLLFLLLAGSAGAHSSSLQFAVLKSRWAQGDPTVVSVTARPAGVVCRLSVRYKDGRYQPNLATVGANGGVAKWKFKVMGDAAPGRATVNATCGGAGSARRAILVVGAVIPARIVVVKDGWSIRQNTFGGGSISYGVILKNASPNQDALSVYTLVNFVGPDNKLVGSATTSVQGIPAGQQFPLGGDISFIGGAPTVSRLEIVVQIQKRQPHALKLPTITNIRIAPNPLEPKWVGSVEGEVSNDELSLVLRNATLSTVVFDGSGNVIGGGSGFASASLPPSAREFFKIQQGLRAIPFGNAASAMVAGVGMYTAP